jgi:glycosyltransferase involved in cell wall biosynthesis
MRVGVVSNEFFDASLGVSLGRMGGFGWAARQVVRYFRRAPEHGVDVVYLSRRHNKSTARELVAHGTRLILRSEDWLDYARRVRAERLDLLLTIDYRPNYHGLLRLLPRTPVIVWVRDPRVPRDAARISSIRIPEAPETPPQGLKDLDCTSLAGVVRCSRWLRRPVLFATPAPSLAAKIPETYGVDPPHVAFLPNIVEIEPTAEKSPRPSVVFLGRLDPYKRPWIFVELARLFPSVEFLMLGKAHFDGKGAWEPRALPPNLRALGHVGDEEKSRRLASAWALVNTSLHEGLAVSLLEALACETPPIASVDPEGVLSRFGVLVEGAEGDGLAALPRFASGLEHLLGDAALRAHLGREGRRWVSSTHSADRFGEAFGTLIRRARRGRT